MIEILGGLVQLAFFGLLVWLGLRALGIRRSDRPGAEGTAVDLAVTVRRLFLLGLLYVALVLAAQGIVDLVAELVATDGRSTTDAARGLAFLVVGLPVAAALVWEIDRRLARDPAERSSTAWTVYLNLALVTGLIGAMVPAANAVRLAATTPVDGSELTAELVAAAVWGGLWAGHWFGFRRRHGIGGDADLAAGTVVGLVPLAIGLGGLVHVGLGAIYEATTDVPIDHDAEAIGRWSGMILVGALAWAWYWLAHYRHGPRTEMWWFTVIPVGALAGFVATVAATAFLIDRVAVWFVGDPGAVRAAHHFRHVPTVVAVLVVGLALFAYHHAFLLGSGTGQGAERAAAGDRQRVRNDPIRVNDYLLAMAALVAAVIGVVVVLASALRFGGERANDVIAGLTLVAVGGPLWWWYWTAIGRHVAAERASGEPGEELRTPIRRVYLFGLFGAGGTAVLIAALSALTGIFNDVLEGEASRQTLERNRIGLAVIVAVIGVAWHHFRVYRAERADYEVPPPPPPPPPTGPPTTAVHPVLVVSGGAVDRSAALAERIGRPVTHWLRADRPDDPDPRLEAIAEAVADQADHAVVVIVDGDRLSTIPLAEASDPIRPRSRARTPVGPAGSPPTTR